VYDRNLKCKFIYVYRSSSDIASTEDSDELIGSVQDAEVCLLKSGEMT